MSEPDPNVCACDEVRQVHRLHHDLFTNEFRQLQIRDQLDRQAQRIVEDDFWYDQEKHKWVVGLKGEAKLMFDGVDQPVLMKPGDFISISAHRTHRVEWTTLDETTVWLAVFNK